LQNRLRGAAIISPYGLEFDAIKLIKKRDGSYVFLELNPNSRYGCVEAVTGSAISKAIASQFACVGHASGRPYT
jgi:hypothetical protein